MKKNNISADNFTSSKINLRSVINAVEFFSKITGSTFESVSISFVKDPEMEEINVKYLSHEGTTDVITFDYTEEDNERKDGEIIICTEQAKRQSKIFGVLLKDELFRLVFHGLLHLTGYDDTDPGKSRKMKSKEDEVLTLWKQFTYCKSNNSGAV